MVAGRPVDGRAKDGRAKDSTTKESRTKESRTKYFHKLGLRLGLELDYKVLVPVS